MQLPRCGVGSGWGLSPLHGGFSIGGAAHPAAVVPLPSCGWGSGVGPVLQVFEGTAGGLVWWHHLLSQPGEAPALAGGSGGRAGLAASSAGQAGLGRLICSRTPPSPEVGCSPAPAPALCSLPPPCTVHSPLCFLQASQLGVYRAFVDNYEVAMETAEKCCQANAQFAEISEVT